MALEYKHYGWECSPYSSKTRSYFRYKNIPFKDIHPNAIQIKWVMERRVGFTSMPTVIAPHGDVLQDSSEIIDTLEKIFTKRSVHPETPKQHLVSYIFELFADEWLPIISMCTRWRNPVNKAFAFEEFGHCALPFLPKIITRPLGKKIGAKMYSYLPVLGITDHSAPEIEKWTDELLQQLNIHFSQYPFLLGTKPCLGDFGLYGPLYALVWRDPGSRRLIEEQPYLYAWLQRLMQPQQLQGAFIEKDRIPKTLWPILIRIFKEQWPVLNQSAHAVAAWIKENPLATKFPRSLGKVQFQLGNTTEERTLTTFPVWMLQRLLDYYQSLNETNAMSVNNFLRDIGGHQALQLTLNFRLKRDNFRISVA